MFTSECSKCSGKGEIAMYRGIAGGVCFSCRGTGKIVTKTKPQPAKKFAVSAIEKASGERITVFWVKAKNEAAALKSARGKMSGANGYIQGSAAIAA